MSSRSFKQRIQDILERTVAIQRFVMGMSFEEFAQDERTIKAVLYDLAIIGEAAASILPEAEARYPQISWVDIRAMRNILIHEYFRADLEIVWATIQQDLPLLESQMQQVLQDLQTGEAE